MLCNACSCRAGWKGVELDRKLVAVIVEGAVASAIICRAKTVAIAFNFFFDFHYVHSRVDISFPFTGTYNDKTICF